MPVPETIDGRGNATAAEKYARSPGTSFAIHGSGARGLNRQNAEGVFYAHDYASTRAVVGVPILPVLGLKISF